MIQVFVICNVASSYIYLRKYRIFHLIKNPNCAIHKSDKDHRVYMIIFFNTFNKKFLFFSDKLLKNESLEILEFKYIAEYFL